MKMDHKQHAGVRVSVTQNLTEEKTQKSTDYGGARIALFVPSLNGGGAERVMSILGRGFADRGLVVDLVLANASGPYLADIPDTVRVVDLKSRRLMTSLPGLVRYLRRERPKAMLSTLFHANVVALWAVALSRVPVRTVIRQSNMLNLGIGREKKLKDRMIAYFLKRTVAKADAVVALNETMAGELQDVVRLPRERIEVINNPVPTEHIASKAEESLDHPWFASDQPPVILGVGRLAYQKDFANLIDAFAIVRSQQPVRLMILGEGELRDALDTQVNELGLNDEVTMPGVEHNPYRYMRRAAVFVLSSRWEGFPNVLVEAMASGALVIATNCPGGTIEILDKGCWGRVVPVADSTAMATAITDAINANSHPEVSLRLSEFSLDSVIDEYRRVLRVGPVQVSEPGQIV